MKKQFAVAALCLIASCSGDGDNDRSADTAQGVDTLSQTSGDSTDIQLIQAMFDEARTRWHYGDKAVLYDMEFEYLRQKHTFDEYLEFQQIKYLEADTLYALTVKDVEFFDRDSATATVEAMFIGPTDDTSYFTDLYRVYYYGGRWIHPTASVIEQQLEFENIRRIADSAAAAEAELEGF